MHRSLDVLTAFSISKLSFDELWEALVILYEHEWVKRVLQVLAHHLFLYLWAAFI